MTKCWFLLLLTLELLLLLLLLLLFSIILYIVVGVYLQGWEGMEGRGEGWEGLTLRKFPLTFFGTQ